MIHVYSIAWPKPCSSSSWFSLNLFLDLPTMDFNSYYFVSTGIFIVRRWRILVCISRGLQGCHALPPPWSLVKMLLLFKSYSTLLIPSIMSLFEDIWLFCKVVFFKGQNWNLISITWWNCNVQLHKFNHVFLAQHIRSDSLCFHAIVSFSAVSCWMFKFDV